MNLETMVESKEIVERWLDLQSHYPRLGQRDGAARLGVTEAELVAAHVGRTAARLGTDWEGTLRWLGAIGPVTGLTRNGHAVIEQIGTYSGVEVKGPTARVLGAGIELRLALPRLHVAFAVTEEAKRGPKRSLQFFDAEGAAIHKVFLCEESNAEEFDALVDLHESEDQNPTQEVALRSEPPMERPDDVVDAGSLRELWETFRDPQAFQHLLDGAGVTRGQALRLVGPRWAERVVTRSYRTVLRHAATSKSPIVVSVGNRDALQIHSGLLHAVKKVDGWFNVLDPAFNLHLDEKGIASAWAVRRPTGDGAVTSLELVDKDDELIASIISTGGHGKADLEPWNDLLAEIERTDRVRVCRDISRWAR